MKDPARENLVELLRQFMEDSAAHSAQADIDAGERILETHPAPAPSRETLATIKGLMIASAARRRRIRVFRGVAAVAAMVLLTVWIGQYRTAPQGRPGVNFASIIPAAIWDSDDLTADDLDLAYFTSELRRIEAQMRAVDAEEAETPRADPADELEMELTAIETEFVKGW
ncbi:MAG: hypothetical protein ACM3VT_04415 [Solirubrobacterales bacterium]